FSGRPGGGNGCRFRFEYRTEQSCAEQTKNAMRTPIYPRCVFAPLAAVAALGVFSASSSAQGSGTNSVPTVPLVNIRTLVPETSEPVCDPDLCDAPTPAPGVFVVSRGGDLTRELTVFLRYRGTASNS